MVWQGLFPGATHTLSWMLAVKFVNVSVTDAYPPVLVTALAALREPIPCAMKKFTVAPTLGVPWLTTRAVNGTLTDAPEPIHTKGVVTPISKRDDVAVMVPLTDWAGL